MKLRRFAALPVLLLPALIFGVASAQEAPTQANSGGSHTSFDTSVEAFTTPLTGFTEAELALFEEGDELFEVEFSAETGLGPMFNEISCGGCHIEDGRGRAPASADETNHGFLLRVALNQNGTGATSAEDSTYGGQFQDRGIAGTADEGDIVITYSPITGSYADGTPYTLVEPNYGLINLGYGPLEAGYTLSPRVANHMSGLGLLEAVPEAAVISLADPNDADGDGISGRPNWVWDVAAGRMALGRFGWKANQPNMAQQVAAAYNGDMGITSSLFPNENCTSAQAACLSASDGVAGTEISDEHLAAVAFYSSSLAVPARRNIADPAVQRGEALFAQANCTGCHTPELQTAAHPSIRVIGAEAIHPYTDLLLHDMGPGLADGQNDFEASGSEWRTAPLWGVGLIETVNGHTYYLHDGRARSLEEAILWHGGEAEAAKEAFRAMPAADRDALIAFLNGL